MNADGSSKDGPFLVLTGDADLRSGGETIDQFQGVGVIEGAEAAVAGGEGADGGVQFVLRRSRARGRR